MIMNLSRKNRRKSSSKRFRNNDNTIHGEADCLKTLLTTKDENIPMYECQKKKSLGLLDYLSSYKGLLFCIIACACFSTGYAIIKYLKTVISAKVIWVNSVCIVVYSFPLIIHKKLNPFGTPSTRKILLCQSIANTLVLYTRYSALQYLPITEASVIIFSYPVMVSLFARIVLNERFGLLQVISAILTVVGVAFVSKLPSEIQETSDLRNLALSDQIVGTLIAFSSTILGAIDTICTRCMKETPVTVILFNNGWVGVFVCLIIILYEGELPVISCGEHSFLIVFYSLIEILGLAFLYKGLKTEQAGLFSVVRAASQVSFVFCWQLFFFKEGLDIWSSSGVILLTFCIICSTFSKYLMSLPLDAHIRRKFSCLI
ncbi:solute carrier family 35 member G1-like [Tachypleus tridentatus]|uniref:solute carrier family 35 member G1-like n=1 Tax=Tachypleus tridentatus TaxID=6853 RepID=UPI003FD0BC55